jgi:GNAT superfamily N-acetyltransferase
MRCAISCTNMLFELELDMKVCREQDVQALEWTGLFSGHRQIIQDTYNRQQRGEALILLGVANDFPFAQVWLDFTRRGTSQRPRAWALRVLPPLQGLGIGTWMLKAAERVAKQRGAQDIEIGVETDNFDAQRLYERLGYRNSGRECEFAPQRAAAIDQYVLSKHL